MALKPISVKLSSFEKLEILRAEIEKRLEEQKQVDKQIRELLYEVERQNFLRDLHPLFQQLQTPQQLASLPELEAYRGALADALAVLQAAINTLESQTRGQTPPAKSGDLSAPAAARPRNRFDSFESFRASRQ